MNTAVEGEVLEREVAMSPQDAGALAMLAKSEIDVQIATARRYPRSVTKFIAEATGLVALNEMVADECIYSLPRDGKNIEGPSARFAEVIAYSWGNCRSAARVIDDQGEFVTAQGVHWDLEKNTAIGYEVKRRITDKKGRRYSADMIGVTANAACSIALRNAILKGIPKAIWVPVYETARKTTMGSFQTLANRRAVILQNYQKYGVTPERVFEKLGVRGEEDISLEHIVTLKGMLNALKEGDTSPEELFPVQQQPGDKSAGAALKDAVAGAGGAEKKADGGDKKEEKKDGSTAASAEDKKKDRPKGTAEVKAKYLKLFQDAKKLDALGDFANEAGVYEWSEKDLGEINKAYHARKTALEKL